MVSFKDKALHCMAMTAEEAFLEAMGLASRNNAYEPEMPEAAKQYKAMHTSKLERLYDKFTKASD